MTEAIITSAIATQVDDIADSASFEASSAEVAAQLARLQPALQTILDRLPSHESEFRAILSGEIETALQLFGAEAAVVKRVDHHRSVGALKTLARSLWLVNDYEWKRP